MQLNGADWHLYVACREMCGKTAHTIIDSNSTLRNFAVARRLAAKAAL